MPGIDPAALAQQLQQFAGGGLLDVFNMLAGGAVQRMAIFALGIMPYISASIIMQLMTTVFPELEALKKEGEAGRKIDQSIYALRHRRRWRRSRPTASPSGWSIGGKASCMRSRLVLPHRPPSSR